MRLLTSSSRIIHRRNSNGYYSNFHFRLFSTTPPTTPPTPTTSIAKDEDPKQPPPPPSTTTTTLLYQRRSSGAFFPRAILTFSTVHMGYWSWYVFEFTPYVQQIASITDPSTVDNTVGYLGLGLAIFMSIGSVIFPKSLIAEIQLQQGDGSGGGSGSEGGSGATDGANVGEKSSSLSSSSSLFSPSSSLLVKTYSLPFVTPSSSPTKYPLGDIVFDSPGDIKKIITNYGGDLSYFSGYLPIHAKGKKINFLLQLTDAKNKDKDKNKDKNKDKQNSSQDEIYEKDLLFKTLVPPELVSVLQKGSSLSSNDTDNASGKKANNVLQKKQRMMERRLLRRR